MHGNSRSQVGYLIKVTSIFKPKTSKHANKHLININFRKKCNLEGFRPSSKLLFHNLGLHLDIFSYSTLFSYRKVWVQVLNFARTKFKVKDIERLTVEIITNFLHSKIDKEVARSTFDAYASALVKLERALNLYSTLRGSTKIYNFELEPSCDVRQRAADELKEEIRPRWYYAPIALICALTNRAQLIAEIQYLAGPRISEVLTLRISNLIGDGVIYLTNTKGGLKRIIEVPESTYYKLIALIEMNGGVFLLPGETVESVSKVYRTHLKNAAIETGQSYEGSHGLRWNYAREAYNKYIRQGMTPEQAAAKVSNDLGHIRPKITAHYLR